MNSIINLFTSNRFYNVKTRKYPKKAPASDRLFLKVFFDISISKDENIYEYLDLVDIPKILNIIYDKSKTVDDTSPQKTIFAESLIILRNELYKPHYDMFRNSRSNYDLNTNTYLNAIRNIFYTKFNKKLSNFTSIKITLSETKRKKLGVLVFKDQKIKFRPYKENIQLVYKQIDEKIKKMKYYDSIKPKENTSSSDETVTVEPIRVPPEKTLIERCMEKDDLSEYSKFLNDKTQKVSMYQLLNDVQYVYSTARPNVTKKETFRDFVKMIKHFVENNYITQKQSLLEYLYEIDPIAFDHPWLLRVQDTLPDQIMVVNISDYDSIEYAIKDLTKIKKNMINASETILSIPKHKKFEDLKLDGKAQDKFLKKDYNGQDGISSIKSNDEENKYRHGRIDPYDNDDTEWKVAIGRSVK